MTWHTFFDAAIMEKAKRHSLPLPEALPVPPRSYTERLSQQGAEVADLRLLCTDLRAEAAAARAEAAAARAEVQRRQSEFDQVADERDQSRGRAAEAESRAGALAADLAVA
jgi:hypothetical protein